MIFKELMGSSIAAAPKVAVTDPNANERIVVKNNGEVEETKTVTRVRR